MSNCVAFVEGRDITSVDIGCRWVVACVTAKCDRSLGPTRTIQRHSHSQTSRYTFPSVSPIRQSTNEYFPGIDLNSRRSSFITMRSSSGTAPSIPSSHGRRSRSCATRSIPDHQSRGNAGQIPPILVSCESPSGVVPPRSSSRQRLAVYMGRHERG